MYFEYLRERQEKGTGDTGAAGSVSHDRMMQNLRFSGALSQLSGLIVGQFSDCEEDQSMKQTISEIIVDAVSEYSFPVCFNFPAGHVDYNLPLILGTNVKLEVTEKKSRLSFY